MISNKRKEELPKPYRLTPYPADLFVVTSYEEAEFVIQEITKSNKLEKEYLRFALDEFPDAAAVFTHTLPNGAVFLMAAFNKTNYKNIPRDKVVGYAVHEAMHVVQNVQRIIYHSDKEPLDNESQAYLLQYIFSLFIKELGYEKYINRK